MEPGNRVSISLVSDEEIPVCFEVLSKSFGHDAPFVDIYFPEHDTPLGRERGSKRLLAWKKGDEKSTFLKATIARAGPGDDEQIVGLAVWTHMVEPPPADISEAENVDEVWPDRDDREFMSRLWRSYVTPRSRAVENSGGKGVYVLELLAIHPDYQRLGAGTALVRWGTKAADEQGLKSVVEGTPVARRLYEQCGLFAEIEEMDFDVGDEFSARRKPTLIYMTREPKS